MEIEYTYLKTDFPNNQYNTTALQNEIKVNDDLLIKYKHIDTFGNEIYINFSDNLTVSEKTSLDGIVANHNMSFGIVVEPQIFETPVIELVDDISFSTPRPTELPSSNQSYSNITVLGQGGPNLSNLTSMSFTWDLNNEQLNSFNFSTSDGQPSWWFNLIPLTTHDFASPNPDFSLMGTGIANLDGNYWINYYEDGIALVSKSGTFSIYASNSDEEIQYIPRDYVEKFLILNPTNSQTFASANDFNVYGSEYNFIKLSSEQSTTSSVYQTVLSLNAIELPLGNYKIVVSHRYGISVTNNQFYSRVLLNGDQLGSDFISRENRNVNRKHNQFNYIETLSGDISIDLQYSSGYGTAYISDMIIEIYRIN
jgi:hypothetical protein